MCNACAASGAAISWPTAACTSGLVPGGFEYKPRDEPRLGDHRQVADLHLDSLRAHSLGHKALEIGIDSAVLGRNRIEARFRSPCGLWGLVGEQGLLERLLDRIKHLCFCRGQIAREIPQEGLLAETSFVTIKIMPAVAGGVG